MNLPLSTRVAARLMLTATAIREIWTHTDWRNVLETTGLCDDELPNHVVVKLATHEDQMLILEYLTDSQFSDLEIKHMEEDKFLASMHVDGNYYAGIGPSAREALIAAIQRHLDTTPHGGKETVTGTHEMNVVSDGTT